jgi:hypothetical protein
LLHRQPVSLPPCAEALVALVDHNTHPALLQGDGERGAANAAASDGD